MHAVPRGSNMYYSWYNVQYNHKIVPPVATVGLNLNQCTVFDSYWRAQNVQTQQVSVSDQAEVQSMWTSLEGPSKCIY